MKRRSLACLLLLVTTAFLADVAAAGTARKPSPSLASLPPPAAAGPLRILLVDDDWSDNNHTPGDTRVSPSDRVFRQLVADAVGGDAAAWAVETVKPTSSGPNVDRLRRFSLVVWYTGSSYGGNPDNSAVLSIEDEKTVRRYLEDTGGAVILVSPGYVSKVLGAGSTWEESTWPFLSEVLGVRGGRGLVQRFESGIVNAPDGAQFRVGKGGTVESQVSTVNPDGAAVLFTASLTAAKRNEQPTPVATVFAYGRGRIVYVGFTFENLEQQDLTPAFRHLLSATGLSPGSSATASRLPTTVPPKVALPAQDAGPAAVQVSGTPTTAVVSWTLPTATILNASPGAAVATTKKTRPTQSPTPGTAASVVVERLVPNAASVRLTVAAPDALKADDAGPLTPGRAVTYRVTLTNGRGESGAREASFTPPLPRDPESLSASVRADGRIVLSWPEVQGVASYRITGTTLAAPVAVSRATEWTSPPQTPGSQQWKVASLYEPGGVLTAASGWPSAMSRVVPTPGKLFLMLPNGNGSLAQTQAYSRTFCTDPFAELSACSAAQFIRDATNWEEVWADREEGPSQRQWMSVPFADLWDLGVGRRVSCAPRRNGTTVCWASSHFPGSGSSVTYDSPAGQAAPGAPNANALAGQAEEFLEARSLSIIVMSDTKAFFGSWKFSGPVVNVVPGHFQGGQWVTSSPPWGALDAEHIYATGAELQTAAVLDSQGRKGVPHACLSCHGGRFDPTTNLVVGASLLPLIPSRLVFPWRTNQQERVRRINEIVLQSNPAPAIVEQLQALYNGAPNTQGATSNDAAIPPGWNQQAGLYRQVIGPYCASCHFAQRGPLHFRSWGNLLQNKDAVQRSVCREYTMPHSEILFRKFWSEGGAVSLPGLLSTSLGFASCP